MKIKELSRGIVAMLLGTLAIFCLLSSGLSAEVNPLSEMEPFYPDCLSDVREFHESFLDSPSRALETEHLGPEALYASYGLYASSYTNSIDNCCQGLNPESIFSGDCEPLSAPGGSDCSQVGPKEIMAINREDHMSTEKQVTYLLSNQPAAGPDGVNAMEIEVAHITVIAINFARGGSAVATSDIYLQPTQDQGAHCQSAI